MRASGWRRGGCRSLSFSCISLIRQRSRLQAFPSFVHVPLFCSLASFMSTVFFVPVNPFFSRPFLSLSEQQRPRWGTARLLTVSSLLRHPPSTLPHKCYNNSIHFSLFIQLWQGRAILMVGVKAYIKDIKHTHTRHSKCWFSDACDDECSNSGLPGFRTAASISIWIWGDISCHHIYIHWQ